MAIGTTIDGLNSVTSLTAQDEVPVWDAEASGEPTKKITAQNMAASVKTLGSLVNTTEMNNALAGKQNTLTFDATPTTGSTNPVTSGGIANAIQQSTASSVTISALSGYSIGMNRSRKIGDTIVLSFRVAKASGTIGTGWQDVAQISGYSATEANMLCCPCNGYNGAMRVEISTTGKISVQNIDSSSTATGLFVNGCL